MIVLCALLGSCLGILQLSSHRPNFTFYSKDTIAVVKHRRHGMPFGVYTSGLVDLSLASKLKDGIGLKR
jgi:hypothetical protein